VIATRYIDEIVCYKAQYYLGKAYDVLNLRLIKDLFLS
jgi:hypothetical protein